MPLYEFFCPDCSLKFELLRPLSQAEDSASCPECHRPAKRKISSFCAHSKNASGTSAMADGSASCGACSASSCSTCRK